MTTEHQKYYVPESSPWPIIGAIGLFLIAVGAGLYVPSLSSGAQGGGVILLLGIGIIIFMMIGWFHNVIKESMAGLYSKQLDMSFRQGMLWFIFSEVMFFVVLFGALFYARFISVPWLGGASNNAMTNDVLWPTFEAIWPLIKMPDSSITQAMEWHGLPLINTAILLISSFTLHLAHINLERGKRGLLKIWLGLTILLGMSFLVLMAEEYVHAYQVMELTFESGIYANTFYMLTGFHGLHVTIGTIFLFILLLRVFKGHFTQDKHFAFVAGSWYWHFVDVVWVCLYLFVYLL